MDAVDAIGVGFTRDPEACSRLCDAVHVRVSTIIIESDKDHDEVVITFMMERGGVIALFLPRRVARELAKVLASSGELPRSFKRGGDG